MDAPTDMQKPGNNQQSFDEESPKSEDSTALSLKVGSVLEKESHGSQVDLCQ